MITQPMTIALDNWTARETWDTPHDDDLFRWFDFVQMIRSERGSIEDERALNEEIERRLFRFHGPMNREYVILRGF